MSLDRVKGAGLTSNILDLNPLDRIPWAPHPVTPCQTLAGGGFYSGLGCCCRPAPTQRLQQPQQLQPVRLSASGKSEQLPPADTDTVNTREGGGGEKEEEAKTRWLNGGESQPPSL